MFEEFGKLYQIDWRIFMTGAEAWLGGRNPYGPLSAEFGAGAFAYPPTALSWLALFAPLGGLSFYLWTALELLLWWALIRRRDRAQLLLLCWSPLILHLVEGQSTLAVILALWAAARAERRGWLWGLALAWALTKPQVAIVPLAWLLWQDRASPLRWRLWGGIALGTALLALPPTLLRPGIWAEWLASLPAYRERILQMGAWQGPSVALFALAAYLWYRGRHGGWQWWLAAGAFPQTSFYAMVALMPVLRPRRSNWTLAGLGLAGVLQGPMSPLALPWILAGHLLAAWMIAGGPRRHPAAAAAPAPPPVEPAR
ncbi:MAG: DUF2029 domain-containing protein [Kouleothrix sp.]|nr:DUF2029 domain-containing protein [Kouleothrix sp.]